MCELIENLVAKHRAQDKRESKIEMALELLRDGIDVRVIEKASGIPLKTIKAEALRLGLDIGK